MSVTLFRKVTMAFLSRDAVLLVLVLRSPSLRLLANSYPVRHRRYFVNSLMYLPKSTRGSWDRLESYILAVLTLGTYLLR